MFYYVYSKATSLDPNFAPAWIGFGHAFAAQDESDQAMASYRTAMRLAPGSHVPGMCIGMEYLRTNNLTLALQYVEQAASICRLDPRVQNELGSIYYKQGKYQDALQAYKKTLDQCKNQSDNQFDIWEPTLFNLGHVYRKLGYFTMEIFVVCAHKIVR